MATVSYVLLKKAKLFKILKKGKCAHIYPVAKSHKLFVACAVANFPPLSGPVRKADHLSFHESQSRRQNGKHCLQETGSQVWLTDWQSREMLRSNMSKIVKCSASARRGFYELCVTHPHCACPPLRGGEQEAPHPQLSVSLPGYCDDLNPSALPANLWPRATRLCTKFFQRRDDAADFSLTARLKTFAAEVTMYQAGHVWQTLRSTEVWKISHLSYRRI